MVIVQLRAGRGQGVVRADRDDHFPAAPEKAGHLFIISAGEITRAARAWLVEKLDAGMRRHIIFMDRDEFLDHAARILLDLRIEPAQFITDDDIPF
ncbi:MAG: hypothetical protein HY646_16010 [Acidobacteria bacterium]|nr:hypothetical protein [Acidobacteriota bacterium]